MITRIFKNKSGQRRNIGNERMNGGLQEVKKAIFARIVNRGNWKMGKRTSSTRNIL